MENFVAQMLNQFESGKITRRQLIASISVAAASLGGASRALAGRAPAQAAPPAKTPAQTAKAAELRTAMAASPLKATSINHFRLTCKDYKPARDFYQEVMGWHLVPGSDNGSECKLAFFPKGATPVGQPKGTPSGFVVFRNGWTAPATPLPDKPNVVINHIAYTVQFDKPLANGKVTWDSGMKGVQGSAHETMRDILTKRQLNPREDNTSYHVVDPNGYDLQISGVGMNGYTG